MVQMQQFDQIPFEANPDIPNVPFGFLPRERASARFEEALSHYQVVLLVAPNGYGKTAFLAHELAGYPGPVAWVAIDDRTTTSAAFLRAVVRAIEHAGCETAAVFDRSNTVDANGSLDNADIDADGPCSGIGDSDSSGSCMDNMNTGIGTDGSNSPTADAYARLAEAIGKTAPRICIVLDGYERAESAETGVRVDYLMGHIPTTARLVIATSSKPRLGVARMKMEGRLIEMGAAELAFDTDEAARFYNETLGFELSDDAVERINDQMDGWAAGLRMAEIALRSGASVESVLSAGSVSQRSISAYLIDDIVNRQEAGIRTFLLESSMFGSFCAELCDSAFERSDSRMAIERILENDLFLQPTGHQGWYRYANFFRICLEDIAAGLAGGGATGAAGLAGGGATDLADDDRRTAHKRASEWFAAHGRYEEALEQALDASDYDQVIALLNNDYATMMGQDSSVHVRNLIHRLPEDIVRRSLWTNIGAAVACEMQQCFIQEDAYVQAALAHASDEHAPDALAADHDSTLYASLCIMQMLDAYHRDDPATAWSIGQSWLGEDAADQRGRCGVLNVMGVAQWYAGDLASAQSCWQESATLATYIDWPYSICLNLFGTAHVHYLCGELESAEETCRQIFAISACRDQPVLSSGYAHMLMAKTLYDRNDLDGARANIRAARRIAETGNERSLAMHADMALARIEVVGGQRAEGIERARRCFSEFCTDPQYRKSFDEARTLMAQIWLLASKSDLAGDYLGSFDSLDSIRDDADGQMERVVAHDVFGSDFRNVWGEVPLFDHLYDLIQTGRTQDVMPWIEYVQSAAGTRGIGHLVLQALILKSLCAFADKDVSAALGWLAESLVLAERSDSMRVYLDAGEPMEKLLLMARRKKLAGRFADKLIAAFSAGRGIPDQVETDFGQTFTRREREVMQLLCDGATNEEMSKRLFLGLSTVKNHLHSIYTKLGVRNRAEAIVRLQELGFSSRTTGNAGGRKSARPGA